MRPRDETQHVQITNVELPFRSVLLLLLKAWIVAVPLLFLFAVAAWAILRALFGPLLPDS
jgi:hypothetical protein